MGRAEPEKTREASEPVLRKRLPREQKAREQAENLLEERARQLFETNLDLETALAALEVKMAAAEEERRRADRAARTDCLTGLPNRCGFSALASSLLEEPGSGPLALFLMDMDLFKLVNDAHGHAAGDGMLRSVADRLRGMLGENAVLARFGGDEFAVLAPVGGPAQVAQLGAAISARLLEPVLYEGAVLKSGASIGAALAPRDGRALEQLLRFADLALYEAKNRGRGRTVLFNQALREKMRERRELRRRLGAAIEAGRIEAWFQPIVCARPPFRRKVEVLARWRDPERGIVNPEIFVPIAEEAGLIGDLDATVLRAASANLRRWFEAGLIDAATVNIAAPVFERSDFAREFLAGLQASKLQKGRIIAEISESAAVTDPDLARDHIETLAKAGVRVALDDFGSGYTNLRALAELPVYGLKLDRSLLRETETDPRIEAFFKGAVRMARTLGVDVVAEGVESRRHAALARVAGCDHLQGFFYARPLSAQGCGAWFTKGRGPQAVL